MNVIEHLNELKLYNERSKRLTDEERVSFLNNVKRLKTKATMVFRGESNLVEQYNVDISEIKQLCERIFMLGEKSKYYLTEKIKAADFTYIWETMKDTVCQLNFNSAHSKEKVYSFLKNNESIRAFFTNKDNKIFFTSFENDNKYKATVYKYYSTILHTISINKNEDSKMLSTSTNYDVAKQFSNNGIILYGWLPQTDDITRPAYGSVEAISEEIKRLGLPTYEIPVYPEQEEITLTCGLLPHFIIGFENNASYFVNPQFLRQRCTKHVLNNGLDIDQSKFNDILKQSGYTSSFIRCENNYYIIKNNCIHTL